MLASSTQSQRLAVAGISQYVAATRFTGTRALIRIRWVSRRAQQAKLLFFGFAVMEVGRLLGGHRFRHQICPKVPGRARDRGRRSQRDELAQQSGGKKGETRTAERQRNEKLRSAILRLPSVVIKTGFHSMRTAMLLFCLLPGLKSRGLISTSCSTSS